MTLNELCDALAFSRYVLTDAGNILALQHIEGDRVEFVRAGKLYDGFPALFIDDDWWGNCSWPVACFNGARLL